MAKGGQTPRDPTSPGMRAAWKQVEAGNVAQARHLARRILDNDPTVEERAEAQELLRRTQTPRAVYGYGLLVLAILAVLVLLALSRY